MSLTTSEMSPADIAAVTNGGGMFGGNNDWWILLLFLLGGYGGYGGFGGGFGGGYGLQGIATRADINEGFALQNITGGIQAIQQGICDSTYALNNTLMGGFHGVDNAVCNLGYQTQAGFNTLSAQLAQCCCDNRAAIADVKYQMATDTCAVQNAIQNTTRDVIENANANSRAILDALNQNYIRSLEQENNSLRLSASQSAQNAVLMAAMDANKAEILRKTGAECPTAAYIVQPPQPVTFPTNCCGQVNYATGGCGSF